MSGNMTLKDHLFCIAGAFGLVGLLMAAIYLLVAKESDLPKRLTDEEVSIEVKRCASFGLILDISMNRRYFQCVPPKVVVINRGD